jgi:hypothetical protein
MKVTIRVFLFSASFSGLVALVYWFTSSERAGSLLLLFMFLAPLFVGTYLAFRRDRGLELQAEDDPNADLAAQAGAGLGRFASASAWPAVMGLGCLALTEGLVYGTWLVVAGTVLFVAAAVGLMAESRG